MNAFPKQPNSRMDFFGNCEVCGEPAAIVAREIIRGKRRFCSVKCLKELR